jgi:hypothetical protein
MHRKVDRVLALEGICRVCDRHRQIDVLVRNSKKRILWRNLYERVNRGVLFYVRLF